MRFYLALVFVVVLWCNGVVEARHHRHRHYNSMDIVTRNRKYDPVNDTKLMSSIKRPVHVNTDSDGGGMNNLSPVGMGYFIRPEVVSPPRRYYPRDSVQYKPIREPSTTVFPNIERLIATRLKMATYRRTGPVERYKPTKGLEEINIDMIPIAEPMRENLDRTNITTKSELSGANKKGEKWTFTTIKPDSEGRDQHKNTTRENAKWPPDKNVYPTKKVSGESISSIGSVHMQDLNNENIIDWHNSLEEINSSDHQDSWEPYSSVSVLTPSRRPTHHSPHRTRRRKHSHRRSSNKSGKNKRKKSRKHKKSKDKNSSKYRHYKDSSDYHHFGHYENNQFYPTYGMNSHRHSYPLKGNRKQTMNNDNQTNRDHDADDHRPGHHDTEQEVNSFAGFSEDSHKVDREETGSQRPSNEEVDKNRPHHETDHYEGQHSEENLENNEVNVSNTDSNNEIHTGEKPAEHHTPNTTPDDYQHQSGEGSVKPTASTDNIHGGTYPSSQEIESIDLHYTSEDEANHEQELPSHSGEYSDHGDDIDHEENNGEYLSTEHSGEMQETQHSHTEEEYMEEYEGDDNGEQYPSLSYNNEDIGSEGSTDDWDPYRGENSQVLSNHSSTENVNSPAEQSPLAPTPNEPQDGSQENPQPEEIDPNVAPSSQEMATPLNLRPQAANIAQVQTSTNSPYKPIIVAVTRPPYRPSRPDSYEDDDDDEGYEDEYDDDYYPPSYNGDDDERDDYDDEYYGATAPGHYSSSYDPYLDDDYPSSSSYYESDYDSEYKKSDLDTDSTERTDQVERTVEKSKRRLRSTLRKRKRRTSRNLTTSVAA